LLAFITYQQEHIYLQIYNIYNIEGADTDSIR